MASLIAAAFAEQQEIIRRDSDILRTKKSAEQKVARAKERAISANDKMVNDLIKEGIPVQLKAVIAEFPAECGIIAVTPRVVMPRENRNEYKIVNGRAEYSIASQLRISFEPSNSAASLEKAKNLYPSIDKDEYSYGYVEKIYNFWPVIVHESVGVRFSADFINGVETSLIYSSRNTEVEKNAICGLICQGRGAGSKAEMVQKSSKKTETLGEAFAALREAAKKNMTPKQHALFVKTIEENTGGAKRSSAKKAAAPSEALHA